MNTIIHKSADRGHADHGWLNARHSFSFANYQDKTKMNFGVIRVLNDDIVAAGKGFGTHPHDNMEIITIPLLGDLAHKDSMGNEAIIKEGDIQVMSAGTGVQHSEFNPNEDKSVNLLQIWLIPKERNVTPRYQQISILDLEKKNELFQILSPNELDEGVWIHQDAWFSMGMLESGTNLTYNIKEQGNGVYAFVIEGAVTIAGKYLSKRDAVGVWDTVSIEICAIADSKMLLMDIPMNL